MLLENLGQDVRFALRQLWKYQGFTALAVGTLALGIAATSTISSWISSTLLNPIPGVARTGRMITIERGERNEHPSPPLSYPDYADLRENARSFSDLVAYHDDFMAITGAGKPERIYGALTSGNYFEALGAQPVLGRTYSASKETELSGTAEVVLSYDLWKTRFAGDPAVLGRMIHINLYPYTIVGVAPRAFQGCKSGLRTDIWLPLGMAGQVWGFHWAQNRGVSWLNVLGVLRPGVDERAAETELNLLMQHIVSQYPTTHRGNNIITTDPLWRSPFGANVYLSGTLPMLLALAAVLLLLACANVANLILVRSVSRRREFAIRLSLGATRLRLVRQLLVESLLIALGAGCAALLLTLWTARLLEAFLPATTLPLSIHGHEDSRVLLATILVSLAAAAVSGAIPALRASHLAPIAVLKEEAVSTSGGLERSRLAASFVVAQVALSLVLLVCAGLFVRSLYNAQKSLTGFDPHRVFLASFDLGPMGYSGTRGIEFDRELLMRLRDVRGVQSATLADFSPLNFTIHSEGVLPEGYVPQLHESMEADHGTVGPNYLHTLRTPLVFGRDFTDQDTAGTQPVAIVNQALVDRYWPGQEAIGRRIKVSAQWMTVVGVASNAKYRRLVHDPAPLVLVPLWQHYESDVTIHLRTTVEPLALNSLIEGTVGGLDPDLPLFNITTLDSSMRMGDVFERVAVSLAGSFGVLALILATVGIYGVVAYTTKQRTHDIGVRIALGAGKRAIFEQVLGQGLRLTLMGLAAGIATSFALTHYVRSMLFGVGIADMLTYATVAVVLFLVAIVACYVPARRATRTDPVAALRSE